jgi:ABC-type transport system substrate-binding protein
MYGMWYQSGGKAGDKPIPEIQELFDLYDKMKMTADPEERLKLGKQIIQSHVDNVWIIGTVRYPTIAIVNKNMKNVPRDGIESYRLYSPGYTNPEQYFFKQ